MRVILAEMAQGHTDAIFDELGPTGGEGCSRRVPAVLRYLGS
ncbi:hypothetical protein ABT269_13555 [Streptomyces viridosporus]